MNLVTDVKNAGYTQSGAIRCDVCFAGSDNYLPYSATERDEEPHGAELYQELTAGVWGVIAPFIETPELLDAARGQKREEIQAWGAARERDVGTFSHNGREWPYNRKIQLRLLAAVSAAELGVLPVGFYITDMAGADVALSTQELMELYKEVLQAVVMRDFEIRKRQCDMLNDVNALTSLQAIRDYLVG